MAASTSREMFFETAPISIDEHRSWFVDALKDKMRQIYIGEIDKKPVGTARFDLQKGKKEASINNNKPINERQRIRERASYFIYKLS